MHDLIVSFIIFAVLYIESFHQLAFHFCIINIEILIITNFNCDNFVILLTIRAINYLTKFATIERTDDFIAIIYHFTCCKLLVNLCIVIQVFEHTSFAVACYAALGVFPGFIAIQFTICNL